ncbi:hypothetical protein RF11_04508 [Thelohanellus kitauei]|uniref:Uncharacterized protein n=1 Tax=Thelohanellus kitauei TaxID=669202 RepID=A0A0C2MU04_THEKT|nr:hypothetical protein RF11_04508 [Thelohanellus kitauei]
MCCVIYIFVFFPSIVVSESFIAMNKSGCMMTLNINMKLVISIQSRSFEFNHFHILWDEIYVTNDVLTLKLDNQISNLVLRMKIYGQDTTEVLFIDETEIQLIYQEIVSFFDTINTLTFVNQIFFRFNTNQNYGSFSLKPIFKPTNSYYEPQIIISFDELSLFIAKLADEMGKPSKSKITIGTSENDGDIIPMGSATRLPNTQNEKNQNPNERSESSWSRTHDSSMLTQRSLTRQLSDATFPQDNTYVLTLLPS